MSLDMHAVIRTETQQGVLGLPVEQTQNGVVGEEQVGALVVVVRVSAEASPHMDAACMGSMGAGGRAWGYQRGQRQQPAAGIYNHIAIGWMLQQLGVHDCWTAGRGKQSSGWRIRARPHTWPHFLMAMTCPR